MSIPIAAAARFSALRFMTTGSRTHTRVPGPTATERLVGAGGGSARATDSSRCPGSPSSHTIAPSLAGRCVRSSASRRLSAVRGE